MTLGGTLNTTIGGETTFSGTGGGGKLGANNNQRNKNHFFFLHDADRLACDPANSFHIYCLYEFKYETSVEQVTREVERILDRVIGSANAYYSNARALFNSGAGGEAANAPVLPEALRRTLVLRGISNSTLAIIIANSTGTSSTAVLNASVTSDTGVDTSRSNSVYGNTSRRASTVANYALGTSPRNRRSSSLSPPRAGKPSSFESMATLEDDLYGMLLNGWPARPSPGAPAPPSRLNVNVYFDIVASRKSLGPQPSTSAPYAVGQHVHAYLQEGYNGSTGRASGIVVNAVKVFVGITDSDSRLACRDVLAPPRVSLHSGGGGGGGKPATAPTANGSTAGDGTFAIATLMSFNNSLQHNISNNNYTMNTLNMSGAMNTTVGGAAAGAAGGALGGLNFPPSLHAAILANANPLHAQRQLQPYTQFLYNTRNSTTSAGSVIPMVLSQSVVLPPNGVERIDQVRLIICFPTQHLRKKKKSKEKDEN